MSGAGPATVRYALADAVATITLARGDRLNAIVPDMLTGLAAALTRAVADGARAVLIAGEGRAFCAGADLGSGDGDGLPDDLGALLEDYYNPLALQLADLPIPVVTAVQGAAAGAGCALALHGDCVVAARSAYFLLAFVNVGLVPDFGATWLVARAAGRARALEMMLLGERVPAATAAGWGLIHKVVDDDALPAEAGALARRLAAGPTRAMAAIRRGVAQALTAPLAEVLAQEAADQRAAGHSADFAEGVAAFRGRRAAEFEGR